MVSSLPSVDLWRVPAGSVALDVRAAELSAVGTRDGIRVVEAPAMNPIPWDELADAHERLEIVRRLNDPILVAEAEARLAVAEEQVGCIGTMMILMACKKSNRPLVNLLEQTFGRQVLSTMRLASRTADVADDAQVRIQILSDRVKVLEREVERLKQESRDGCSGRFDSGSAASWSKLGSTNGSRSASTIGAETHTTFAGP